MMRSMNKVWKELNDWSRAFIWAIILLFVLHMFVVRWVIVDSTSMYATLRPGDLLLVERWPIWTGLSRGDIVVFRDPLKDDRPMATRPLLVKRIVGMPGDRVELRQGTLFINGQRAPEWGSPTRAYLVRLREPHFADSLAIRLGLPPQAIQRGRSHVEVPMNTELARRVLELPYVVGAEEMRLASGAPRHIFPFSTRYPWNSDTFGPITVPARGDTIHAGVEVMPLYDRLISVYEGRDLDVEGNVLGPDGSPVKTHVVQQDYYFVLGDGRHHSSDSRYWGFLPKDHITGRAGLLLWGKGTDGMRSGRDWTPL